MSKPTKDLNAWATMPMTKDKPIAHNPVKAEVAETGYDVLRVIQESQQKQAADTVRTMASHFMSQVPNMDAMTDKERDTMMEDFLDKLKDMMENDTSDFRHFVESYVKDLSKDAVAADNKLSNKQLHQMGAMSTKGKLLQSAGMRISSNIHKLGPTRRQLGIVDSNLLEKPSEAATSTLGKAYEKTKGFRDLFKEKESEEDKKTPEFDKKRFEEDSKYRKKMLDYTKDIQKEAKEGNILTRKQQKLLEDKAKSEKLKHFIERPEDRMTDGGKLMFSLAKGLGKAGKGVFNAGKNYIESKRTTGVETLLEPSIETKAEESIKSSPEAVKAASTASNPIVAKLSKEKVAELAGDKYKFNADTNRWHDKDSNKMVKAATVEGYAKEQQGNIQEKDEQEEEKLVELLEKIEHNTDPENLKKKEKAEDKEKSGGMLDSAGSIMGGGVKLAALITASVAAAINYGTYKIAKGGNAERDENSTSSTVEQTDENGKNIGDDEDRPFHYENGKLIYDSSDGYTPSKKQIEQINKPSVEKAIPRKDIYEGRKRLIDLSEAETVKKSNASKLSAAEDKVTASKESKDAAKLVSNVTNAPTTNNIVSGGGSGRFRQNVYNPDSSFNKWVDSRVSYA